MAVCGKGLVAALSVGIVIILCLHTITQAEAQQRRTATPKNFAELSYYELLGVDRHASKEEIKKAFHEMSRRYHPDKHQTKSEEERAQIAALYTQITTGMAPPLSQQTPLTLPPCQSV